MAADQEPNGDAPARRTWTNVYLAFSLPEEDRARLDATLAARGTSLGQEFHTALTRCLIEAGVDPRGLSRPDVDPDEH
ncbi:MAG TPA: hypothetical protein VK501_28265 [Baekduia sp.]|uniref:hypothetical protein n=1 Tax=Baekduia sp. TaxID=2600305 RepID=UPI002C560A1A|nr:hypothetical protein [Baekduia sp.]HMJ37836.1 hypothetical protein [Baekduia sp.]